VLPEQARREIRKTLIRLAQKNQKPGTGSTRRFLLERTARMEWPDLTSILGNIPWAAVGAVATRAYMPERVTADLDVAVRVQDAPEIRRRLDAAGYRREGELTIGGAGWDTPDGQHIDVLEVEEPWLQSGILHASSHRDPQGLPVLPLPHLVLMKYRAGRLQDTADVGRMLGQASDDQLAETRALFRDQARDDLEDLESLIQLGKMEMQ
jgi:hypothetical protein